MLRLSAFILICFVSCMGAQVFAQSSAFNASGLPLPRYVSLASNKVYMRTGPGRKYPILWVFQKRDLPVEIIMEFENWRKIRDPLGETGWVHKSLLSGRRYVMVKSSDVVNMHSDPSASSKVMAHAEPSVVAQLQQCPTPSWCEISASGYRGWIERKFLWGVYADEVLN